MKNTCISETMPSYDQHHAPSPSSSSSSNCISSTHARATELHLRVISAVKPSPSSEKHFKSSFFPHSIPKLRVLDWGYVKCRKNCSSRMTRPGHVNRPWLVLYNHANICSFSQPQREGSKLIHSTAFVRFRPLTHTHNAINRNDIQRQGSLKSDAVSWLCDDIMGLN